MIRERNLKRAKEKEERGEREKQKLDLVTNAKFSFPRRRNPPLFKMKSKEYERLKVKSSNCAQAMKSSVE